MGKNTGKNAVRFSTEADHSGNVGRAGDIFGDVAGDAVYFSDGDAFGGVACDAPDDTVNDAACGNDYTGNCGDKYNVAYDFEDDDDFFGMDGFDFGPSADEKKRQRKERRAKEREFSKNNTRGRRFAMKMKGRAN